MTIPLHRIYFLEFYTDIIQEMDRHQENKDNTWMDKSVRETKELLDKVYKDLETKYWNDSRQEIASQVLDVGAVLAMLYTKLHVLEDK